MMPEVLSLLMLGVSTIATQLITAHSTQQVIRKIVEESTHSTHKLLREILKLQKSAHSLQKDMALCLRKIDVGMRANAMMHGWLRVDEISPEEAEKLPEPKVYGEKLRICYCKSF